MVDNTIALQLKSPQIESPINRMAKFMQLQAFKAQADTAQQATAKNAMLNQAFSAAVDPKTGAIDYGKAAAFLAANGGGAYAPDVLTSGAAATTAQTNAAAGKFKLGRDQIDASVRDIASYKTPADAIAHLKRSVETGLVDSQTATALAAEIPQDPAQFEGWRITKVRSLLTAAQQLETKFADQNFGGGQRTIAIPAYGGGGGATVVPGSTVANTMTPDAVSSARTAANRLAFDQRSEVTRALMEGVLPEAVGLGGPPAPSAGAGAPMGAPGGGGAPMAAPAGAAAPTAAPAAPAVAPNGAPLARDKREAERFSELTKKMPEAEVKLDAAVNEIDQQIRLVESIVADSSLPNITGGGTGKYKSTIQSFLPGPADEAFFGKANLADLQTKIDQLSSEGMFVRMQELRAASPTGSTGLAAQSNAEGQTLRESFARLNQAQSTEAYTQALTEVLDNMRRSRDTIRNAYTAEFAPLGRASPGFISTTRDGQEHVFDSLDQVRAFNREVAAMEAEAGRKASAK